MSLRANMVEVRRSAKSTRIGAVIAVGCRASAGRSTAASTALLGDAADMLGNILVSLALFALAFSRIDADFVGRARAAYGGAQIAASPGWLWLA